MREFSIKKVMNQATNSKNSYGLDRRMCHLTTLASSQHMFHNNKLIEGSSRTLKKSTNNHYMLKVHKEAKALPTTFN